MLRGPTHSPIEYRGAAGVSRPPTTLGIHFANRMGLVKMRRSSTIKRLVVVTGDHHRPDSTKLGGAWGPQDLDTHRQMVAALESLSRFEISVIDNHDSLFERIVRAQPDLVVNFCDTGVFNQPIRELHLPAWLELHDIPYTGATPQAMVLCFDKQIVRLVAQALDVEVPQEVYLPAGAAVDRLPNIYPALLKPNQADGSVGITKDAVVRQPAEARKYLEFLARELPGRDVLWQEYLLGPEYGVGLIGNPETKLTVLPALEVDFSRLPAGLNPILPFESKADPNSPYWTEIKFQRAQIDSKVERRIGTWSEMLFKRFGLRDYGRFDFRVAADGRPKLMEINPNPAWASDGKLAFMAGFASIAYAHMLEMVIDAAIARLGAR
jgi:D-alanine-D-alanine ligase